MIEKYYMETPCTSEPPRQPDDRIPTMKMNVFEAESLERACELAQTFWETQGYYVIGPSVRTYNRKPQR